MAYILKTNYADKTNYGSSRATSKIKYIVVHYTANDGDTDESNAKYFKRKNIKASAHYFVDDDSVTISVPDTVVAWSVGGRRYSNYKKTGGAKYYSKCTNSNSISIEMCDTVKDGKIMASKSTMTNTIALILELMKKYNIPKENVIRHFDVTGKSCPAYFVNSGMWNSFKLRLNLTQPLIPNFSYNGIDYSPVFNPSYYNLHSDLKKAFDGNVESLFNHFCKNGMKEFRQASAEFNPKVYKANSPDLVKAFGNDMPRYYSHYCTYGKNENRKHK